MNPNLKTRPAPSRRMTVIPPRTPDRVLLERLAEDLDVVVMIHDESGRAVGAFVMAQISLSTLDSLCCLDSDLADLEPEEDADPEDMPDLDGEPLLEEAEEAEIVLTPAGMTLGATLDARMRRRGL